MQHSTAKPNLFSPFQPSSVYPSSALELSTVPPFDAALAQTLAHHISGAITPPVANEGLNPFRSPAQAKEAAPQSLLPAAILSSSRKLSPAPEGQPTSGTSQPGKGCSTAGRFGVPAAKRCHQLPAQAPSNLPQHCTEQTLPLSAAGSDVPDQSQVSECWKEIPVLASSADCGEQVKPSWLFIACFHGAEVPTAHPAAAEPQRAAQPWGIILWQAA